MTVNLEWAPREQLRGDLTGRVFATEASRYTLGGKIGDGAIGVVRKARSHTTNNIVAVKFLAPDPKYIDETMFEDIYRRFGREGKRGTSLDHPNLVEIYSYQENRDGECFEIKDDATPNNPFVLMEFVHGRTLEDFIRKKKSIPSPSYNMDKQTLYIAYQVASALEHLHRRRLVHRDVKPANIFLSKTREDELPRVVKLGDFGIVKWRDFKQSVMSGTLTVSNQRGLGTLKYMAPEQSLKPKDVDVKTDMYAFGITLFELFTNQILPDVHHVFNINQVRMDMSSGSKTTDGKLNTLGLGPLLPHLRRYQHLWKDILDMFLRPSGRPTSKKMVGVLKNLMDGLN